MFLLFVDGMIIYLENSKESIRKPTRIKGSIRWLDIINIH